MRLRRPHTVAISLGVAALMVASTLTTYADTVISTTGHVARKLND